MIAVDTNVLVYAHRPDSAFHDVAVRTIAPLAEGPTQWAIPWACLHEFYSVVTSTWAYDPPSEPSDAIDQIAAWLESPTVRLLSETASHARTLESLLDAAGCRGPMIYDARIAAICLDHGVQELITMDRDFARFPALRTRSLLT